MIGNATADFGRARRCWRPCATRSRLLESLVTLSKRQGTQDCF